MQVIPEADARPKFLGFSILIGSGGDASAQYHNHSTFSVSFSILIGSGGDASMIGAGITNVTDCFSILIGSGGDARHYFASSLCLPHWFQYPHRIGW